MLHGIHSQTRLHVPIRAIRLDFHSSSQLVIYAALVPEVECGVWTFHLRGVQEDYFPLPIRVLLTLQTIHYHKHVAISRYRCFTMARTARHHASCHRRT
jgi:hypothetical protein